MTRTTPPIRKRSQSGTKRSHLGPMRPFDHTPDYALTTLGCSQQKRHISAAFTPLTTLTTPYFINKDIEWNIGVAEGVSGRLPISTRGVVTPGVVTAP